MPIEVVMLATTRSTSRNGKKQHRTNLKPSLQLAQDVSRHDHLNRQVLFAVRPHRHPRRCKHRQIFLPRIPQHVPLHRGHAAVYRFAPVIVPAL